MPALSSGMIHRVRVLASRDAVTRNAQGEYDRSEGTPGPWAVGRVMERGAVAAEARDTAGTRSRVGRSYEILIAPAALDGTPVEVTAASVVEVDCPILFPDGARLPIDGEPERLNDGETRIGWLANSTVPLERT